MYRFDGGTRQFAPSPLAGWEKQTDTEGSCTAGEKCSLLATLHLFLFFVRLFCGREPAGGRALEGPPPQCACGGTVRTGRDEWSAGGGGVLGLVLAVSF